MATYTPRYPYDQLGTAFNAEWLNTLNKNFDDIEQDLRRMVNYIDASLAEIRADVAAFKEEVRKMLDNLKTYIDQQITIVRTELQTAVKTLSDRIEALETQVGYTVWKEPVESYSWIRSKYPNPVKGWTVQTLDDNKIYVYDGSQWVWSMQYGVGTFNPYVFIEPAELKAKIQAIANRTV